MDRYAKTFTVRWADCDVNGHMRNTAYSEYAIDVRIAFLSQHGFPYEHFQAARFGPVILHEATDFLREVHLGQEISVDLSLAGLSPDSARFKFEHNVWLPNGKKAARIVLAGGWMDLTLRKLRLPPEELAAVTRQMPRTEGFEDMKPLRRDL